MLVGLVAGLASAVCYGVASVLQAVAAQRERTADADRTAPPGSAVPAGSAAPAAPARPTGPAASAARTRPVAGAARTPGPAAVPRPARTGLLRMVARLPFVAGLALDGCGFGCQFLALRSAPVFLVQPAMAASVAVTAVVAAPVLRVRLRRTEWLAVAAVVVGLALLGASAGAEATVAVRPALRYGLLAAVPVLAGAGYAAGRISAPLRPAALGAVAGLGFAVTAVAVRSLGSLAPAALLRDPAGYALVAAGVLGFLCYAAALQAGSVTTATAATVVCETVVPAALGVLLLGDTTRAGYVPVAAVGFTAAVAGTLALARFGEAPGPGGPARPDEG